MTSNPNLNQNIPDIDFFLSLYKDQSDFRHGPNEFKLKKGYGTRLNKGLTHYLNKIVKHNNNLRILDLGCGSGGNKTYINELGSENVVSVDIRGEGVDVTGDALRLPFKTNTFDLILSTAVIEHLPDPFLAFREISRVLKDDGQLLATVSFWEKWHDNSCFHLTPTGIYVLCRSAGFEIISIWSGWGFLESIISHAISPKLKIVGHVLQLAFDFLLKIFKGEETVYKHRLKTSGSLCIYATSSENTSKAHSC